MNFKVGKYAIIVTAKSGYVFSSTAKIHGFNIIGGTEYATISYWVDGRRFVKALPVEPSKFLDDVKIIQIDSKHFIATSDPVVKRVKFNVGSTYAYSHKNGDSKTVMISAKYASPNNHILYVVLDDSEIFEVFESDNCVEYISDGDFVVSASDEIF